MTQFRLRKATKKYPLQVLPYLEEDRANIRAIAAEFASAFSIGYEKIR